MLASRHRLRGERAFRDVMAKGRRWSTTEATIHALRVEPAGTPLLGLVVGRKALRRSVDRNAFKRRVRGAFAKQLAEIEGLQVVPVDDPQQGNHSGPRLAAASVARRFEDVVRWCASASS
jgi:ribonuclease P protein component